jgi:PAS domain S-box-containing protein
MSALASTSTLPQLRGLLEVTRLVRDERDLTRLVDRIAETISGSLGWRTVAISLHRPATDDLEVVTVHGSEAAREALEGVARPLDAFAPYLDERFCRRGAYMIPQHAVDWQEMPSHIPDFVPLAEPDGWQPEDALVVPMRGRDGCLLGVVSVDEPESGLRPGDAELDVLVAFADHVAAAIESAQLDAAAARDRAALKQLLDVSASLVELDSVETVLATVAEGIHCALDFEKVAVCLSGDDGAFVPAGTAGWAPLEPGLDFTLLNADLDAIFVPEFEVEGCYLIENEVARAIVGSGSTYSSTRNGAGPRAWFHHWLLVPLVERDGSRRGFIWVDDPADSLLPSPERLQALRTFANQATMALRAAVDFETLNARNRELGALHDTAHALLEQLDLDGVLTAIVENASHLVATPDAYLYLADPQTGSARMQVGLGHFAAHVGRQVQPGRGGSGKVLETARTVVVDDYRSWPDRLGDYDEIAFGSVIGVPLHAGGELAGVIGVAREEVRPFVRGEIALLERFASLASIALENARLYAAARQSEELHRSVVDGSTDLIALLDADSRIVLASRAYRDVLGYEPADLLGRQLGELLHPDDLASARAKAVDRAIAEPHTARLRHRDGSWILVEGISTPIRDRAGAAELVLVIARDVTERERLQDQLRHAQKMESIGRLAGGIAHDFNNLLTAIRGYAELIMIDFDAGASPSRDSAEQIARAAERAAELTGQLLAFSRKQVLRPQLLDLNDVVAGMAPMLARMLGEDVVLTTALDADLRPTLADPTQIEQVVLNLAINARDVMQDGGRLLVRTANLDLDDRPHVALVVTDTGTGIDAETAARIFEPFFTTKDVGAGTGLGLATVHGIVAQSGGTITVDSQPGGGTTFTVCLPRAADAS